MINLRDAERARAEVEALLTPNRHVIGVGVGATDGVPHVMVLVTDERRVAIPTRIMGVEVRGLVYGHRAA